MPIIQAEGRMISIRNEVDELERIHNARRLVAECYVSAIRNSAEYAVELEEELTGPFRQHLLALADEAAVGSPDVLEESRATLRNLLRDYRDKASRYLNSLREELAGATRGLEELMESLARADGEHDGNLRGALTRLRTVSTISDVRTLRALALREAGTIEISIEELRQQHQLVTSQFQAEIRVLHRRIDALERAASVDALGEMLQRPKLEELLEQGVPGCSLLIIKTGGFRQAASHFDSDVAVELAGAFVKRLRNGLKAGSQLGRWTEDGFVAILEGSKEDAGKAAKWISEHLSGAYSCLQDGKTVRPSLHVSVAVIDGNTEPRQILNRVREFLPVGAREVKVATAGPHR